MLKEFFKPTKIKLELSLLFAVLLTFLLWSLAQKGAAICTLEACPILPDELKTGQEKLFQFPNILPDCCPHLVTFSEFTKELFIGIIIPFVTNFSILYVIISLIIFIYNKMITHP